MKSKKLIKVLSFVTILLTIIMAVSPVFADMPDPSEFTGTSGSGASMVNTAVNMILGIVQIVAVGVAVIMLIVLAIKYISASPEGKADIKKTAVQYVVGAVLLFGASGILQVVKGFAQDIGGGTK